MHTRGQTSCLSNVKQLDLATQMPARAAELSSRLSDYLQQVGAQLPVANRQ